MSDFAIRATRLGKQYRLGAVSPYQTLRERIGGLVSAPLRFLKPRPENGNPFFWALKDVSFDVRRGEVMGVIGRNGAGKSTLLKILSRITEPSEGEADLNGRVGSLLEVGTGFHGELTGRENIFLNGAILGMKRAEVLRKFADIVDFAEVDKFLDTPVKHYSSGMYMRLAFAVAAHLEPEILVVDEVLAVGDAEFQKKCLGKMGEVARGGRTVLFVSHNMGAVQNLCHRALLLERGRVRMIAPAADAIHCYMTTSRQCDGKLNLAGRRFAPKQVEFLDGWLERDGLGAASLQFGDEATVVLRLAIRERVRFSVELLLRQQDGLPVAFAASGLAQGWEIDQPPGEVTVRCRLPAARYAAGSYSIDAIAAITGLQYLDYIESGLGFEVEGVAIGARSWAFSQNSGVGYSLWDVGFEIASSQ
jgi:lipopolysaccharide transport system ATP-binding protein